MALIGVWLSLVEHCVRDAGVAGSNPVTPMSKGIREVGCLFYFPSKLSVKNYYLYGGYYDKIQKV